MTTADAVEVLVSGALMAWMISEWLVIWSQRPPVVYDPWTGHWRAQRAMEKRSAGYPISHVGPRHATVPRLRPVRDLAS